MMLMRLRQHRGWGIWLVILVLLALLPIAIESGFYLRILTLALLAVIVGVGVDIVLGMAGQLSIDQAAFFGLSAYASALLMVRAHWAWIPASLAGVVVAVVAGGVIGIISLRLRGHYLAIVTLGFTLVVNQVLINWVDLTGGPLGLTGIPRPKPLTLGGLTINWRQNEYYFYLVLLVVAAAVFLAQRMKVTRLGTIFRCIREDEIAAAHIGINITRYKILAFVLSAAYAGAAGGLYASFVGILAPSLFGIPQSANYLIVATIGGLGSVTGVAISTFALTLLPELLREVDQWREIVYGCLLLITVIFFPRGLASSGEILSSIFRQSGNRRLAQALAHEEPGEQVASNAEAETSDAQTVATKKGEHHA